MHRVHKDPYTFFYIVNNISCYILINFESLTSPDPPFKLIRTNTDRPDTYDFLLTFHSNQPRSHLVGIQRQTGISVKNCNFPIPIYLMPTVSGNWVTPDGLGVLPATFPTNLVNSICSSTEHL